jgi:hypothetical protein
LPSFNFLLILPFDPSGLSLSLSLLLLFYNFLSIGPILSFVIAKPRNTKALHQLQILLIVIIFLRLEDLPQRSSLYFLIDILLISIPLSFDLNRSLPDLLRNLFLNISHTILGKLH